ncbi:MAG: decarboxylating 6-phosphogluconate dehydrogenase [Cytophagales bacterium]|jgi:6-phosphogluconate dehydrogenase|nr:decarboxylating 6-phosphogluconate dehydrogenase [Cytophagales bacterium]MCA6389075.1 decarboxylating 6-phosphogluconate dehydrogenase [Cytophagales bacterium]MCA6390779.1 decarboxylating 6-phosphogluconate dehydrogenase [Cytophagales bacterium]MCA6396288.1 decarboxylating 6-phosphogluconate dehydrogenase [Cytophagales bacterium]MCA6399590.1 decarboxylating 6-phosphogluconate dehydrogenase [Cytophagales bacterium]
MQIGLVGLGKMGYNLALNFKSKGFEVVAFDVNKSAAEKISREGVTTMAAMSDMALALNGRKVIWLMVPAGHVVDVVLNNLKIYLNQGDIIIDGGNSHFKDTLARARDLEKIGVELLDCGTSGGVDGARNGVCTMIGGNKEVFDYCESIFKAISVPNGFLYCGKTGNGHFTKMVHNGIEYGMMQAMAEGLEVLHRYDTDVDLAAVSKVWNHGSVVRSWLMELTQSALEKDKNLESIKGVMHSSGEGKWTVEAALEMGVPTPVITMSLLMRYRSQVEDTFSGKVVAALRNEFGGHAVEKK